MGDNYYWLLQYAKKLKKFFAADIQEAMNADGIYFPIGTIVRAIQYWITEGKIIVLNTPCYTHSGAQKIHEYVFLEDK